MFHQTSPSFLGLAIECAPLIISLSIARLRDSSSSPLMSLKTLKLNLAVSIAHQRGLLKSWTPLKRGQSLSSKTTLDLGIRTDPWLLAFCLWFQVQNRTSRSATASKRRRKRYRLYQRYQYCLNKLCMPTEAPIPESGVDH